MIEINEDEYPEKIKIWKINKIYLDKFSADPSKSLLYLEF